MPTSTRRQVRQQLLDRDFTGGLYGTATAGAAGTLTDTTLLQIGGHAASRYGNFYKYRPAAVNAADVYRRVTAIGYAPTTGVLVHGGPNYTQAPLVGGDSGYYELWPWDPREINHAFSRALTERVFSIQQDDITTNGQSRYEVSAAPFSLSSIESGNQIFDVSRVLGTEPNARVHSLPLNDVWRAEMDNDVLYVRFDPRPTGVIRITWKKAYTDITDETSTTTADRAWLMWATLFELLDAMEKRAGKDGESSQNYADLKERAYNRYWARRQMFMREYASQLHVPRPRARSSSSTPVMGRGGSSRLGGNMQTMVGP